MTENLKHFSDFLTLVECIINHLKKGKKLYIINIIYNIYIIKFSLHKQLIYF